jgi:hypothetical protein
MSSKKSSGTNLLEQKRSKYFREAFDIVQRTQKKFGNRFVGTKALPAFWGSRKHRTEASKKILRANLLQQMGSKFFRQVINTIP